MSGTLSPVAQQQFFDANGDPLDGGKLRYFITGTSTPAIVYKNALLTSQHPIPLVLDAGGWAGAIYMASGSYKLYITDANDVPVGPNGGYTDPVESVDLSSVQIGQVYFEFGGEEETPITATSYPSGNTAQELHADTTILTVASRPPGTYRLCAMLRSEAGVIVNAGLVAIDDSPDFAFVAIASNSADGASTKSAPFTFPNIGSARFGIKVKMSTTGVGFAWSIQLERVT